MLKNILFFSFYFLICIFLYSCGNTEEQKIITHSETQSEYTEEQKSNCQLGIALSGQVERVSDVEYKVTGPEIKCSAILIDGDSQTIVTSEVKWISEPEGSAEFSEGAAGVYLIPNQKGSIKIYALYPYEGEVQKKSPEFTLIFP